VQPPTPSGRIVGGSWAAGWIGLTTRNTTVTLSLAAWSTARPTAATWLHSGAFRLIRRVRTLSGAKRRRNPEEETLEVPLPLSPSLVAAPSLASLASRVCISDHSGVPVTSRCHCNRADRCELSHLSLPSRPMPCTFQRLRLSHVLCPWDFG
jgi:hypothetical protein